MSRRFGRNQKRHMRAAPPSPREWLFVGALLALGLVLSVL